MSTIKTVAVAGASGNIGPPIVNQLLQDGFKVTALARKGTTHTFPPTVTVAEIDYDSPASLHAALQGQDAVVSAIGFAGLPLQIPLIQAAIQAGVQRFLPSEYGSDAENPAALELPPFGSKKAAAELLAKEAANGKITYTLVSTGPFLDMALQHGMFVDLKGKKANLWNGGDVVFSTTSMPSVAKAVSGVLLHPAQTQNRNVYVRSVNTTQNVLLAKAKKALGGDGWVTTVTRTEDALEKAYASLQTDQIDRLGFISAAIWGEGYGGEFRVVDNALLGVHELSDAELQEVVDGFAK